MLSITSTHSKKTEGIDLSMVMEMEADTNWHEFLFFLYVSVL